MKREVNCQKMLDLIKEKFQVCQKISKENDTDCKKFNQQFCTAFKSFPCCTDVFLLIFLVQSTLFRSKKKSRDKIEATYFF